MLVAVGNPNLTDITLKYLQQVDLDEFNKSNKASKSKMMDFISNIIKQGLMSDNYF